jgi:hypothetical protein
MISYLHAQKQQIDDIFSLARTFQPEEEVLSHWAKYLCILTSGLIENGMRLIFGEYVRLHASRQVTNYVVKELEHATNFNAEKIRQLIGAFSEDWRQAFDIVLTDAHKDALDSIIANRHNIAHGRPVGISLVTMREYYQRVCEVLEWISQTVIGR